MKFGNMQDWQSDPQLEREGVKLDIERDRWILMRRAGGANRAYLTALAGLITQLGDDVAQTLVADGLKPIFAKHVVLGWGGICNEKGDEIPFSEEVFLELMEAAPDLWTRIRVEAEKRERFQREHLEQEKTHMGKSLGGKRNGGRTAHA